MLSSRLNCFLSEWVICVDFRIRWCWLCLVDKENCDDLLLGDVYVYWVEYVDVWV